MKYPSLVRKQDCRTNVNITIETNDIDENGAPVIFKNIKTKCNYQGGGKKYYDEKHQLIELSGIALIPGDICHSLAEITSGTVVIFNEKRNIFKCTKARNPDGSVNYTKLELI